MATITDFTTWLSGANIEDHNEVYCIYKAVSQLEEWEAFNCTERTTLKGRMYFLKCSYIDEVLMLASENARNAFLKHLEATYAGEEMDIESWYYLKEAIYKND
jgi:hypothetical protein